MKIFFLWSICILCKNVHSQTNNCEKLIIITIDGIRWQEIFEGADSTLLFDPKIKKEASLVEKFWASQKEQRRALLMPFMWQYLKNNGQILGNRNFKNKMQVKNIARISYAGYNELFTGHADNSIWTNRPARNKNVNVLEYLNSKVENCDSIAVFTSWNVFPFILNNERSKLLMNCGYDFNTIESGVTKKDSLDISSATRKDSTTFLLAKNYMEKYKPKILYLGFGEADEFAHHKDYTNYLKNLHMVDQMIATIWEMVQIDEAYKNKTSILITTDHGRGNKQKNWNRHGFFVKGSKNTWMAAMGNCIKASGENTLPNQLYTYQIAPTIANLFGANFINNKESLLETLTK